MRASRARPSAAGLVVLLSGACAGGAPTVPTPSATAPPDTAATACATAEAERARVSALLAEGKLDRARRVLARAAELCPETAPHGWVDELATLAELGDWDAVRALAKRVDADAGAPPAAKDAARAAVARADADVRLPDTDDAKAPMRAAYIGAATASAANDHQAALAGFLEAWKLWHPNGQALIEAGRQASILGDRVEARRLMDRGIAELERSAGKPMTLDPRNGPGRKPKHAVWSAGGRIALPVENGASAADDEVVVLSQSTMGETIRIAGLGDVSQVDVSADGKLVAVSSWSSESRDPDARFGMVSVWDARAGTRVRAWTELPPPLSVAFTADGKEVVATTMDAGVRAWSVESGEPTGVVEHATSGRAALVDADTLAVSIDGAIEITDRAGKKLSKLAGRDIMVVAVSRAATGARVATIETDASGVVVWDPTSGKRVAHVGKSWPKWHTDYVPAGFALSPDGASIVVGVEVHGATDAYVTKDVVLATGEELWTASTLVEMDVETFSPDGKMFLRTVDDGWELMSAKGGDMQRADRRHSHVSVGAFASDDKLFLWEDRYGAAPYSYDVDLMGGDLRAYPFQVVAHSGPITIGDCKTMDIRTHAGSALSECGVVLAVSRDGKVAATRRQKGVTVWDLAPPTASPRSEEIPSEHGGAALSMDGSALASARGSDLREWDTRTGAEFAHHGAEGSISVLTFSSSPSSADTFATAGKEQAIRVWRHGVDEAVRVLPRAHATDVHPRSLAFSPDGAWLASGWSDETITVWSLADGSERATLVGSNVEFAPSSSLLSAGSEEGSVRLYRVTSSAFEPIATLRAISQQGTGYVFTPDGFVGFLGERGADARGLVRCRIGAVAFPFSVCRERFEVTDLGAKLLAGDTSYRLP